MSRPQPHHNKGFGDNFQAMLTRREDGAPEQITQEELAEWEFNGCMICGAPTGLMADVEVIGRGPSRIRTDGTVNYDDLDEVSRQVVKVYCSECGTTIWEK